MTDDVELECRRRKFALVLAAQSADDERMNAVRAVDAQRAERQPEVESILSTFLAGGDIEDFRHEIDKWCRKPGYTGFNSAAGQMFLNQIVKAADQEEVAPLLRNVLPVPATDEEAAERITQLVGFVEKVKKGGYPAPARVPFLLSFFWALQDRQRWPMAWPSATRIVGRVGWYVPTGSYVRGYLQYRDIVVALDHPLAAVEHALYWWDQHPLWGSTRRSWSVLGVSSSSTSDSLRRASTATRLSVRPPSGRLG